MKVRKRLYFAALILFGVSLAALIAAMIAHAALGDDQVVTVFLGAGSGLAALTGIVFACVSKVRIRK